MSGVQTFQLRAFLLCGALTPPFTATNTDEVICMNIVKHIIRLQQSDAFLAACDSFGYGVYAAGGGDD